MIRRQPLRDRQTWLGALGLRELEQVKQSDAERERRRLLHKHAANRDRMAKGSPYYAKASQGKELPQIRMIVSKWFVDADGFPTRIVRAA